MKYKKEFKNSIASIWYQIESSLENPDGAERAKFYPSSRPYFIVDGSFLEEFLAGSEAKILNKINERKLLSAPVTISISSTCQSTSGNASVTINNISPSVISGTLHVLLKERGVKYSNSWKAGFVDNVMRDMLPDTKGESVTIQPGQSIIKTRSFTLNNAWKKDSCRLVAFLQKPNKEIIEGCISLVNSQVSTSTETSIGACKITILKAHSPLITLYNPENDIKFLSILNIQGRILVKHKITHDNEIIDIPIKNYTGLMFLQIQTGNRTYVENIMSY